VFEQIAACRPVNREAVFLAGYSQGGYAVSMIGEQRADQIAGMVLLGSGRRHAKMYLEEAEVVKGLPIFIGAGEKDDPHHFYADVTAQLYGLLGAKVTMETWPDTNHGQGWSWYQKDPTRGEGLKSWLDDVVLSRTKSVQE
jgi:predicted esterase